MRLLVSLVALCFLVAASCQTKPVPQPKPSPDGSTCETDFANLQKLGGCGLNMATFLSNCHDREKFEAEFGADNGHSCVTGAPDCNAARGCK